MKQWIPNSAVLLVIVFALPAHADVGAGQKAYWKGDYSAALRELKPAAELGDAQAQLIMGLMYDSGYGVSQDYKEAARWYRLAALQGLPEAQHNLGVMYHEGEGVPKDDKEAVKWYRLAAEQGDAEAQHNLGVMYHEGEGVSRDYKEAAKWYRLAAEQGRVEAQVKLALQYQDGTGIPKDDKEAVRWFRQAASQGYPDGQYFLGWMYYKGNGVPQNYVRAYMWLSLGASNGDSKSAELRDFLETLMTPEQVAEAQDLASRWRPTAPNSARTKERSDLAWRTLPPGFKRLRKLAGSGTGFLVSSQGQVLTNYHVVDGCTALMAKSDAGSQKLKLLARDIQNDFALLGFFKPASSALPFSDNQRVKLGQAIVALGYPLQGLLASSLNLTTGSVSALAGIGDDTRMFQITAPVQPGNSGGPLLDQSGNVVGVVTSKLDALRVASLVGDLTQNVNFAIKGSLALSFLESNGVDYVTALSTETAPTPALAEKARKSVLVVECWK